jgi:amino acid transporter
MLVIAQWGQVIGWGTNDLAKLGPSSEIPALVIAHRIWGSLWWLTLLAMITSVLGVTLACQNVATRMWYSMGRAGVLPASFARVHPTRKTPTMAVLAQAILSVGVGIVGPYFMGTWPFFIFLVGYTLVLAVIFVYIAANIGLVKYFLTEARSEFNFILHFVFPVGTSLVLLYSIYAAFVPLPAAPNNYTPLVAALWLVAGIVIVIYMKAQGRSDWLTKAGEVIAEREATASEKPVL